jgi:deazaflavin-dependent oxidoreductase (nitroreductase family)
MYKIINPTFKLLLRTPLHGLMSKRLMVLTFRGRKSGKTYSIPVGYVQDGNTLYVSTQSGWKNNLRDNAVVNMRLRGEGRRGTANLITDVEGMTAGFAIVLKHAPELSNIIGVQLGPDGTPRLEDVVTAQAQGYVVVRIDLQ